jgi:hypothetical protein
MDGVINKNGRSLPCEKTNKNIHPMTIYGTLKNSKLYGKCVILFKLYIFICNIKYYKSSQ